MQAFNPYLPGWEYTPDGEPHVFGGRVYVYGSHDRFNGHAFCLNDYVCWSALADVFIGVSAPHVVSPLRSACLYGRL